MRIPCTRNGIRTHTGAILSRLSPADWTTRAYETIVSNFRQPVNCFRKSSNNLPKILRKLRAPSRTRTYKSFDTGTLNLRVCQFLHESVCLQKLLYQTFERKSIFQKLSSSFQQTAESARKKRIQSSAFCETR